MNSYKTVKCKGQQTPLKNNRTSSLTSHQLIMAPYTTLLLSFLIAFSLFGKDIGLAARHLLDIEVPKLEAPEFPHLPDLPKFEVPKLPQVPELPDFPEVPKIEVPQLPHLPEVPKEVPHLPEVPKVEEPDLPHLPQVPEAQEPHLPEFPKPTFPTIPTLPKFEGHP